MGQDIVVQKVWIKTNLLYDLKDLSHLLSKSDQTKKLDHKRLKTSLSHIKEGDQIMSIATSTEVRQIMQTHLVTVGPKTSIFEAAKLMDEENVGTVLVVSSDNKLLGMITDRQIVVRVVAHKRDLATTCADEIMTRWPMTIFPETTCKEALDIMGDYGYRRLPVEKGGKLAGIISISDLASIAEFDNECIQDMVKELSDDARYK